MVAKYRTTEEANGGGGGIVILAAATQQRRRRATDIGGGVDKNNEGRWIWGRSVLKGFQKKKKLGASSHACSRGVILNTKKTISCQNQKN
jgi:hypothetical protein